MDDATLRAVLDDAGELGISVALLAGGEPLTRPGLLDIVSEYPDMLFPIFTNGLLIDDDVAARLRRQRNTIPVLSIEGNQEITDDRRGAGVWTRVRGAARALRRARVFFGSSFTVRSDTLDALTDERFIAEMIGLGCRLFFFVEYVPVQPGTESWEWRCRTMPVRSVLGFQRSRNTSQGCTEVSVARGHPRRPRPVWRHVRRVCVVEAT